MIGKTYLDRGEPVVCRARWATGIGKVIRNVLIETSRRHARRQAIPRTAAAKGRLVSLVPHTTERHTK